MLELEEKLVVFHTEINNMDDVEVREIKDCRTDLERSKIAEERCLLLENEVSKLKSELMSLNGRFEALEVEKLAVEDEFRVLRRKYEDLQLVSQGGIPDKLIDLTDEKEESDILADLMIENKVLECEKKKAESEVETWKNKFKELEGLLKGSGNFYVSRKLEGSRELPEMVKKEMTEAKLEDGLTAAMSFNTENKLERGGDRIDADDCMGSTLLYRDKGNEILESSGTPITLFNALVEREDIGVLPGNKMKYGSRVRKQLFREAGSPNKNISPSTPAGGRPASVCVIDIVDSDCESDTKLPKTESREKFKRVILEESDEEDIDAYKGSLPTTTPKRKRASNIFTSDSECDDDDDDKPICKFISQPPEELDIDSHLGSFHEEKDDEAITGQCLRLRKREVKDESQGSSSIPSKRLTRLRRFESKDKLERRSPSPSKLKTTSKNNCFANEDEEDEEMEGDGSESEGNSLGGFIVESSDETEGGIDDSEGEDESVSDDVADESDDDSDGNLDIGEIMSQIRRKKNQKLKWEFEGDMLASFGEDPEMCMKAVCALYRQQTADEKNCKETIYKNQRGFSQCDASRGTKLAEFLTDGDPKGDLVKSVEQLEAHNRKGVELCRTLATHYSKQLFEIYQKKEDPFFLPS